MATASRNPFVLEARDLVALIEAKAPVAIGNWQELGGEEYARSFTAAGTMGYDIVADLQEGLLRVLREDGATEEDFVRQLLPILRQKGWLADKDDRQAASRLLLIYDTNLRTAQAVGRWNRIQKTKAALPYLYSFTAADERVRHPPKSLLHDHRAYEGIILPVDHPFWTDYFPPLGFRCRCQVVQRSRSQAAKLGGVTSEVELAERRRRLGKPWGFNPGRDPLAGVNEAATRANTRRLEGSPALDPTTLAEQGRAAFQKALDGARREFRSPVRADVRAETIKVRPKATVIRELSAEFKEAAGHPDYSVVSRFRGRGVADWGVAKLGAGFDANTVSMLAALKPELDDLARQIGIPALRGFKTLPKNSRANADQGDGVMGLNPATFNARAARVGTNKPAPNRAAYEAKVRELDDKRRPLETMLDDVIREMDELRDRYPDIPTIRLRPGAVELLERRKALIEQIEDLQAQAWLLRREAGRLQPASKWRPGDPVAERPWTVADYYEEGVDKGRSTLFHEFGHHVHQYLNVQAHNRLDPPLERALKPLFAEYMRTRKGRSPSTYSEANEKEWFVENFSAYVMGRRDLVDPEALKLIERIFRGEFS